MSANPGTTRKRYVARNSKTAARRLGDEMMVMSPLDSTVFTLNEVAAAIWEEADGTSSLDQIVERRICQEFEVTREVALQDAEAVAEELAGHGILVLSDAPIQPNDSSRPEAK
ncbi:MAG: PqqD family protein [Candidatus Acidiferrales bacterium]